MWSVIVTLLSEFRRPEESIEDNLLLVLITRHLLSKLWQQCYYHRSVCRPGRRKWPPHQEWYCWHPLKFLFPSLAVRSGADVVWVEKQSFNDAAVPVVDPQHAQWTFDGVVADTTGVDRTRILARLYENIMVITRDRKLLNFLTWSPWRPRPAFHALCMETYSCSVSAVSIRTSK